MEEIRENVLDFIAEYPGPFYQLLLQRFRPLSNDDLISFLQSVYSIEPWTPSQSDSTRERGITVAESLGPFAFTRREFTLQQLREISTFLPVENMDSLVRYQLTRKAGRKQKFLFLKEFHDAVLRKKVAAEGYDQIALELIRDFPFDLQKPQHLDELLTASCYVADPNLSLRLQKTALQLMLEGGLEKMDDLLFHDARVQDYAAIGARERYIDELILQPEKLGEVKKDLTSQLETLGEGQFDNLVMKEALMNALLQDKEQLLQALLSTQKSDKDLKTYVAEQALGGMMEVREMSETGMVLERAKSPPRYDPEGGDAHFSPSEFLDLLYRLDYGGRCLLAQQLLIGKEGVLLDESSRTSSLQWFFDTFIARPVKEEEKAPYEFLQRSFRAVAEKAEVSNLYFLVHPLIVERMLGRPQKKISWQGALQRAQRKILQKKSFGSEQEKYYFKEELAEIADLTHNFIYRGKEALLLTSEAKNVEKEEEVQGRTLVELNRRCARYLPETAPSAETISAIDFVKQLATKLGAPGVRFLQCLGIYARLAPELRAEFDDVYDNVKGQLKLSAFHTLTREWPGGKGLEGLDEFGKRIGGGSLVTVYEGKVQGQKAVLKVLNPNVLYRANRICTDLRKVFSIDEQLAKGLPLIDNIERWIKADVSFQGLQYETRFREEHHGFTAAGSDYRIIVPQILSYGKKYVVEEYVDGDNLTQWDTLAERHEMKEVISLLARNIFQQLQSGLLHGDIHVGNIRVTGNKEIAWLDRNYMIELTPADQQFITGIYGNRDPSGLIAAYLCSFPENEEIEQEKLGEAVQARLQSAETVETAGGNGPGRPVLYSISDIVGELYQAGGRLPLKPLLLVKNALAVDRLLQRAGFTDLRGALEYKEDTV